MTLEERLARDELASVLEQAARQARHGDLLGCHRLILKSTDKFNDLLGHQQLSQIKEVSR